MLAILSLAGLLVGLGMVEKWRHRRCLARIDLRVHVNGTRGKSTVTRLVAAGLRASGRTVIAKTTGTAARLIAEDGTETPFRRNVLAGPVSIGEQRRLVRLAAACNASALVVECMAVHPEMQQVVEQEFIRGTVCVITNVRRDHADVMGDTPEAVARTLALTIPEGGTLILGHNVACAELFMHEAERKHCVVVRTDAHALAETELARFSSLAFADNICTALAVCEHAGVDRAVALRGMENALPDPGALKIVRAQWENSLFWLVDAFAANDPDSTLDAWALCGQHPELAGLPVVGVCNNRSDRGFRTRDLVAGFASPVRHDARFRGVVVLGDALLTARHLFSRAGLAVTLQRSLFTVPTVPEVLERALSLVPASEREQGVVLFGFGNTKGMGSAISAWFLAHPPTTGELA